MMERDPAPWTDKLTPLIKVGDQRVLLNGNPVRAACRVITEGNFQYAKYCVNNHDALIEALEALLAIPTEEFDSVTCSWKYAEHDAWDAARKAIAKAKES